MKIATWNVNSIRARLDQIIDWLAINDIDILAIQETKVQDKDFPLDTFSELGYNCSFYGQKSYNGVAFLANSNIELLAKNIPSFEDPQCRALAANIGGVTLVNLYVPNGSELGSEKYNYKISWLNALNVWLSGLLKSHSNVIVLGDFNIAPTDDDVHDPSGWEGKILCSDEERSQLEAITRLGLKDSFRSFPQEPEIFSWWDYRAGGFQRNRGLRIDLILNSQSLDDRLVACSIDPTPRRNTRPSDHAPVILEIQ
jgi:exodeoxyribonuclease-3|tara:strand:- start:133 stop:897 length:765 start_codon:yes stop_codon:yes gene_type:complete